MCNLNVFKPFAALFVNQKLVVKFVWSVFDSRVSSQVLSFEKKKSIRLTEFKLQTTITVYVVNDKAFR